MIRTIASRRFLAARISVAGLSGVLAVLACWQGRPVIAGDWLGSSSCGSSTCHGNTVGRGPAWTYSYTLSRALDPHATAGSLLYDEDSRRIVSTLAPQIAALPPEQQSTAYDVVLRRRCISCHLTATPSDIASSDTLDRQQIGEGVSCESCHGPAGDWLDAHILASWQGPARYESSRGMLDTESMIARAEGCVRCHIGSRSSDALVRDMNHDLIAAGHPALRFDLLIYNDNLPHHWDDASEVERAFGQSARKVRSVGRSIGLVAAAKLSSERAAASSSPQPDNHAAVPWPELSDFDCFACHQSLLPRSYRLPINVDGKPKLEISNGLPLWNAWFTAQPVGLVDSQFRRFRPKPGGQSEWITVANKVAELYRTQAIVDATEEMPSATASIGALRRELNKQAPSDWHAAAAFYLEMDAAARDLVSQVATRGLGERIALALEENVAPLLRFDLDADDDHSRLRSPKDFDPRTFRTNTLKALDSIEDVQP